MKLKFIYILGLSLLASSLCTAQQTVYDEPTLIYTKSLHGGIHIHPKGWGLNFAYGDIQSVERTVFYNIEVLGMKHAKEIKTEPFNEDFRKYTYGKLNAFYIVRPSIAVKRKLTEKYRKAGVEVSWLNGFGPSIGFTKPIYLEIEDQDSPLGSGQTRIERYDPDKHQSNDINGQASILEGFGELKIRPGLHARSSLFFELSPYQSTMKGIETGVALDAYLEEIPIMAIEKNNQFFFSFYINLFIGQKYNRSINEND